MTNTPPPDQDDDGVTIRPFISWLREQSSGRTHDELSEGLHDLIARVRDTGKRGTITLVVAVETLKGDADVLVVTDEIKLKLPEHDRSASMFYPDKHGNLTRTDPRQLTFDELREVPPQGVDAGTGEIQENNA